MKDYIEKTLHGVQRIYDDLFYAETAASGKGLMQRLDPRVKLLGGFALILSVNLMPEIGGVGILIGYTFVLALLSRIQWPRYLLRVSLTAFVFAGLVALPSIFSFVRPGRMLWPISGGIYITEQGMTGAALLFLRSFGSLSLVYLIAASTRWNDILRALRFLHIPGVFVATLEMAHRYVFMGLELTSQLFMAQRSRMLAGGTGAKSRRLVASAAGILLVRTARMADDVGAAMAARGYTGRIRTLSRFEAGAPDYLWLGLSLGVVAVTGLLRI